MELESEGEMDVMEIKAPRGSMRLKAFPPFEGYKPNYHYDYLWNRLSDKEKLERYFKNRNRCLRQQAQCIKAFMKQHRIKRRNGHRRQVAKDKEDML